MEWQILLENFLLWIVEQNILLIWLFFFFSNFLENVFPPWPGDTVTVFGGFLVAKSQEIEGGGFGIFGLISSTYLGNIFGAYLMIKFGDKFLKWVQIKEFPFKKELYDEKKIQKTFHWFEKNEVIVILLSRFSAGIRFFVAIIAGMVGINIFKFFLYFSISVFLWCGLLIQGGYSLGSNWGLIVEYIALYNRVFFSSLGLVLIIFLFYSLLKKKS
ncbi:MAG: DedA family protein [Leptospira sp.]|jgi:membrane protein DedA with SNARE-associated domain|nr:DedA family protein [Leptospira sp.]